MIYAVGMKGWVELRSSDTPLERRESKLKKEVERDYDWFEPVERSRIRVPLEIPIIYFNGGTHLATVKSSQFRRSFGFCPAYGECFQVGLTPRKI